MKTLHIIVLGVLCCPLFICAIVISPYFFPVHFPQPTGPFGVGTQTQCLTMPHEQEWHSPHADQKRELVIQWWYPTDKKVRKATMPWAPEWVALLERHHSICKLLALDNIYTYAQEHAPLATANGHYPVIIYSHGLGHGVLNDNTALCEELASTGYVVISVSHPYASAVVRFPDGREIKNTINTDVLPYTERQTLATKEMELWITDIRYVLDYLETLATHHTPSIIFNGHLDLRHIGIFGHSFGGAAAVQMCRRDHRCKACINMDGKLYGQQPTSPFHKPCMLLLASESIKPSSLSEQEILKRYQTHENYEVSCKEHGPAFDELVCAIGRDAYKITINGTGHGAFSDLALVKKHSLLMRLLPMETGLLNVSRSHEIIKAYVCDFFDRYLKGKSSALLDNQIARYPEAEIRSYKSIE